MSSVCRPWGQLWCTRSSISRPRSDTSVRGEVVGEAGGGVVGLPSGDFHQPVGVEGEEGVHGQRHKWWGDTRRRRGCRAGGRGRR